MSNHNENAIGTTAGSGKICDTATAVQGIQDGSVIASVGVIGWITPDAVLRALGERFEKEGHPRDLTAYLPVGVGDAVGIRGMDHIAREGMLKRIISGSYINPVHPETGERPRLMQLVRANQVEAYSWPIGASMHWLREVARKGPGYLTKIGLDTYMDPRLRGGKFTACATDDLVRRVTFEGEDYLFYPRWNLDTAIIRATAADDAGNLSFEDEPIISSAVALAIAVKSCGGTVIAQVRRVVPRHSRPAREVRIPGVLVDHVVVDTEQMMCTDVPFDAAYLGTERRSLSDLPRLPMSADKVIARRAAREVEEGTLSIFGFGASSDVPLVMAEEGLFDGDGIDRYNFTTEHGPHGGIVMSGWQFSANMNPDALLEGPTQFDLIDGGLCPFTALAFAQLDQTGVVNVSKFGLANPGAGGFTDIARNARRLVFTGTFTTGGLAVSFDNGQLQIQREGKVRKFVREAEDVTYRVIQGVRELGQRATVITERAVFEVTPEGLKLTEIAPGVDLERDVLGQMEFAPVAIAEPLKLMDAALFQEGTVV